MYRRTIAKNKVQDKYVEAKNYILNIIKVNDKNL